ncbi:12478_t:CDS:2 [Funneliformis mosseae]|uniref:12478_t:CDS:1 n=1 Tax=Funneliformis mosseae TaxID=27381 RepID=A0A9N8YZR2_FUNMO|nr:12478_t:CDS:2 [Funneliformis mosseae]
MSDDKTDEAYNEFIKEFELKYRWDNYSDNISASSSIEDNLSYEMKLITCTDSENTLSDEMSGLIATQLLDRNQVTE